MASRTLERLRNNGGTEEEYLSLLPEIAELMGTSVAVLQRRPKELQLLLARTYVGHWESNRQTLQEILRQVTTLDFSAEMQLQQKSKQRQTQKQSASDGQSEHMRQNGETQRYFYRLEYLKAKAAWIQGQGADARRYEQHSEAEQERNLS